MQGTGKKPALGRNEVSSSPLVRGSRGHIQLQAQGTDWRGAEVPF